jgi:hypothetical protein
MNRIKEIENVLKAHAKKNYADRIDVHNYMKKVGALYAQPTSSDKWARARRVNLAVVRDCWKYEIYSTMDLCEILDKYLESGKEYEITYFLNLLKKITVICNSLSDTQGNFSDAHTFVEEEDKLGDSMKFVDFIGSLPFSSPMKIDIKYQSLGLIKLKDNYFSHRVEVVDTRVVEILELD